MQFVQQNTYG
jgi:hypothetical protein